MYQKGFETLSTEHTLPDLPVHGQIPAWLNGTLIRNGPGQFEVGDRRLTHWFDGFAQLHAFTISGGAVTYRTQFLKTRGYEAAKETGTISYAEFGTDPCRTTFQKIFSVFKLPSTDDFSLNANVNITRLAGQMVALTEVAVPIAFDPETLDTLGVVDYEDALNDVITTAHPHYDYRRRRQVNYLSHIGPVSAYKVYGLAEGSTNRSVIGTHKTRQLAYMHSFGMSQNYAILVETPFVVSPADLLVGKAFMNALHWKPNRGTIFTLIHLDTGEVEHYEGEAFASFHHVNAFEEDGFLNVDLVCYDDALIYTLGFQLETILDKGERVPSGELRRYRIRLGSDRPAQREVLSPQPMELPRINYRRFNTQPYRFAYGISNSLEHPDGFANQLVKADVQAREAVVWREEGTYPGEPVFVAAPDATSEDDGVVLSVVLHGEAGTSFLLVLNAQTFTELARVPVPHHIPFGFHGQFLS
ncbi:MAG: carotenoid oxygenase family protein [Chloroflexi bacterium]|nr:carotenoid oxygenase family protein [Chloroflexota bacterium]